MWKISAQDSVSGNMYVVTWPGEWGYMFASTQQPLFPLWGEEMMQLKKP